MSEPIDEISQLEARVSQLESMVESNSIMLNEYRLSQAWAVRKTTDLILTRITYWQVTVISLALVFIYAMIDQSI